jgi:hypothetical protein
MKGLPVSSIAMLVKTVGLILCHGGGLPERLPLISSGIAAQTTVFFIAGISTRDLM